MSFQIRGGRSAAAVAVLLSLIATGADAGGRPDLVRDSLAHGKPYLTGEVMVQFAPSATASQRTRALSKVGGQALGQFKHDLMLARIPAGVAMGKALDALEADGAVAFAEPNWIYQHTATSNDPLFTNGSLWGMYGDASSPANQYGSQAAEAWAAGHTCGSDVYVGIIDEGFMYSHEDLAANAWTNPFDPVDGVDNDGNGYVDDTHGWDFAGNDNSTFDGTGDDHGTHVAGTIGAVGGNGKGVAGVCWSVKLISGKFLGRRGGSTANAVLAVDYMTDLKQRHGLNIVATNNSWGGGGFSQALADAIERANGAGILFIAAAGNETVNNDATPHYPSSYDNANIIAVASITSTGGLSSFSNWGASSVDIGAPGSSIQSTLPVSSKGKVVSGYGAYSGTSMATPHVTGAAALYASTHPGASHLQIQSAILSSATPTASLAGKCTTGARLNAGGF
jgi:subtilisin family serine protease